MKPLAVEAVSTAPAMERVQSGQGQSRQDLCPSRPGGQTRGRLA
jgi:hypothetical protein